MAELYQSIFFTLGRCKNSGIREKLRQSKTQLISSYYQMSHDNIITVFFSTHYLEHPHNLALLRFLPYVISLGAKTYLTHGFRGITVENMTLVDQNRITNMEKHSLMKRQNKGTTESRRCSDQFLERIRASLAELGQQMGSGDLLAYQSLDCPSICSFVQPGRDRKKCFSG